MQIHLKPMLRLLLFQWAKVCCGGSCLSGGLVVVCSCRRRCRLDHACSLVKKKSLVEQKKDLLKKELTWGSRHVYVSSPHCCCCYCCWWPQLLAVKGGEREREDGTCHSDKGSLKSTSITWFLRVGLKGLVTKKKKKKNQPCDHYNLWGCLLPPPGLTERVSISYYFLL